MTTLETERLLIRNFRLNDWQALHEIICQYQSSDLAIYDQQWPTSPEEIKTITEHFANQDSALAVCRKDTGQLIGFVALGAEDEQDQSRFNFGYIFNFHYHGKGYATEACQAVLCYAFDRLQVDKVIAGTAANNKGSCRLLERLGFKMTSESLCSFAKTRAGDPIEFVGYGFEISRDEWNILEKQRVV